MLATLMDSYLRPMYMGYLKPAEKETGDLRKEKDDSWLFIISNLLMYDVILLFNSLPASTIKRRDVVVICTDVQ